MQFNGASGYNSNGEYTYPYGFTVSGQQANLMCISLNNEITPGETWKANVATVASLWGTQNANLYDQAAWLLLQENSSGFDPAINWVVWSLFAPSVDLSPIPNAGNWLTAAQGQTFHAGEFSNVFVYTPVDGTQSWGGTPQTFLGYNTPTPEPGSLMLMGSGILGLAGVLRRKVAAMRG
jgi:hypothetical protein